jgi:hypothetical protein
MPEMPAADAALQADSDPKILGPIETASAFAAVAVVGLGHAGLRYFGAASPESP